MIQFDPASFRDPGGRLFRQGDVVYRTCSPQALSSFRAAEDSRLVEQLVTAGLMLPVATVDTTHEGLDVHTLGPVLLRQPAVPLVTYSHEWSFSMLRDAALVTLAAMDQCLTKGFILKDSTAYNVLFEGTAPRLVDVHSLEQRQDGGVWAGYAQFCRAFLFPLMIWSYKGIDPRPLLLHGLGEVPVDQAASLLGTFRDRFRPGVFLNVRMQHSLEKRFAERAGDVSAAGSRVQYPAAAIRAQVQRLRTTIEKLDVPAGDQWTGYATANTYDSDARRTKETFVSESVAACRPATVLDLGTNTGHFARLARTSGARVIAIDASAGSIDALYRQAAGDTALHPVAASLTTPTPAVGWRLLERPSLLARLRGDLSLSLALIHHLRISGGIPLGEVVDFLAGLAPACVIEWVGRDDPMVRQLLALRPDVYDDYDQQQFEMLLGQRRRIVRKSPLPGQDRALYYAHGPA